MLIIKAYITLFMITIAVNSVLTILRLFTGKIYIRQGANNKGLYNIVHDCNSGQQCFNSFQYLHSTRERWVLLSNLTKLFRLLDSVMSLTSGFL